MPLAQTVPAAEARTGFYKMLDQVKNLHERFTITRNGKPEAVVLSADEFEEWVETLEVLSSPKLMATLKSSGKDFRQGKTLSHEDVFGKRKKP